MKRRRIRSVLVALVALLAAGLAAQAQDAEAPTLQVSELGGYGPHLANAEGMSLYLYVQDEEGASACVDACTRNWPPALVEGEPELGEGVDPELVGTIEREDGSTQLTYAGHPLYAYVRDAAPGDTRGQALANQFFLVSPAGERVTEAVAPEATEVDEEVFAALMEEGERGYASNCAVCHGAEGQGQVGPRLAENDRLANTEFFVGRILNGFPEHGMPAFRGQLNDRQVAAIATFSRNSWGNDFGAVTEEEVSELR